MPGCTLEFSNSCGKLAGIPMKIAGTTEMAFGWQRCIVLLLLLTGMVVTALRSEPPVVKVTGTLWLARCFSDGSCSSPCLEGGCCTLESGQKNPAAIVTRMSLAADSGATVGSSRCQPACSAGCLCDQWEDDPLSDGTNTDLISPAPCSPLAVVDQKQFLAFIQNDPVSRHGAPPDLPPKIPSWA